MNNLRKLLLLMSLLSAANGFGQGFDLGDLPECNYPTFFGNPSHTTSQKAWLGQCITQDDEPWYGNLDACDDGVDYLGGQWTAGTHTFSFIDPGVSDIGFYPGVFRWRLTGRLIGRNGFGQYNPFDCETMPFCGNFSAEGLGEVEDYWIPDLQLPGPWVEIISPNGGENWPVNSPHTITWISNSNIPNFHIHVYRGNPPHGTFLQSITANTPNDGSYEWTVWPWLQPGSDYYIGIADVDDEPWDYSNAPFTISAPSLGYVQGIATNSAGQPLNLATVSIPSLNIQTTTNAQGNYQINAIPPGQYLVTASKTGYITSNTNVSVGAGQVTYANLTLQPELSVLLLVRGAAGVPLSNAHVHTLGPTESDGTTGADGSFTFYVSPGLYRFRVTANGYSEHISDPPHSFQTGGPFYPVVSMAEVQHVTQPTYVFLIRGISMSRMNRNDTDAANWQPFIDSFDSRYHDELNMHRESVPINPFRSVDDNALRLDSLIRVRTANNPDVKIILVGHSMGGIIARTYLAFTRDARVEKLFTIDSPHAGSGWGTTGNVLYQYLCRADLNDEVGCPDSYRDMTPRYMRARNRVLEPFEQILTTKYIIISSSRCVIDFLNSDECGDFVVTRESQRGFDLCAEGVCQTDVFDNLFSRVRRPTSFVPTSSRRQFHSVQMRDPNIVAYIVANLNRPWNEFPQGSLTEAEPFQPLPSTLWESAFQIDPNATRTDTIPIPSVSFYSLLSFGWIPELSISLESPSGIVFDDSSDFANSNGAFDVDTVASTWYASLPSPPAGNWLLHVESSSPDSSVIAVSIRAPVPLFLDPLPPQAVFNIGADIPLTTHVTSVSGVTLDSVTAQILGDSVIYQLNDSGINGDEVASDSIWSVVPFLANESGEYDVDLVAYAHAGSEQYRVQGTLNYSVHPLIASVSDVLLWQPIDADSNSLYEELAVPFVIHVDSAAQLQISATLTDLTGEFISATSAEDSLAAGDHTLTLRFDGKHIADHRLNGPYSVRDLRLNRIQATGTSTLEYYEFAVDGPPYSYSLFEGRPGLVENVGAVRTGASIECFWTPHNDPDISHFKLYYDTDGGEPYQFDTLAGNGLSFTLNNTDSSLSYIIAVTAIDSADSESDYSLPYTVFANSTPDSVNNLTVLVTGNNYLLTWSPVADGARYRIESASSPDGPWTAIALTYSTSYQRPIDSLDEKKYFHVLAER